MKFSIVIPLYNKASYLPATLASVRAQSFADYEIVVVDDGSTDGGPELLDEHSDTRVRLVTQRNAGVAAARNRGVAEARGEWVAFLDADDWWHPQHLSTLCTLMRHCPEVDLLASGYRDVQHCAGASYMPWPVAPAPLERIDDLPACWHRRHLFFTSSVAVRATQARAMAPLFRDGESYGEDVDAWFRVAETTPIAFSPAALVARLVVPGGLENDAVRLTEPPFLRRLEARALAGELRPDLQRSALRLVAENRVTLARRHMAAGQRGIGLNWLIKGMHAARGHRWWVAAALLAAPAIVVRHWHLWRIKVNTR